MENTVVGVIGAGIMGRGIAQLAAQHGHKTLIYDAAPGRAAEAKEAIDALFNRLVAKGRLSSEQAAAASDKLQIADDIAEFGACGMVIEAIIEDVTAKQSLFAELSKHCRADCILATNTSSLSIAKLSSSASRPAQFIGVHFFNPAPVLPLVEVVPGLHTSAEVLQAVLKLVKSWGKISVVAKDTPGFIVNRIARPFYGEALRIYEEGIADCASIDWAMRELGGFRMGPFELMDLIGLDTNLAVSESVFQEMYCDPRYRPSIIQKRMIEAGLLGRKSGEGFYRYHEGESYPEPQRDKDLGRRVLERILGMIFNEAAEAAYLRVACEEDIDLAMTKGVNYPKGPLAWLREYGPERVLALLEELQKLYGDDRYRPSRYLRELAANDGKAVVR